MNAGTLPTFPQEQDEAPTVIYLDHQATTPVDPRVLEQMWPYFSVFFGNAASKDHLYGNLAAAAVDASRVQVSKLIGAREQEIVFTSGATEANNAALFGVMDAYSSKGDHLITTTTEHKAVLDTALRLEQLGKQVTYLPVDQFGSVDPEQLRASIRPTTVAVSIMAANNEIGTIAPLAEIGTITREHGILLHTDATQAVGQIKLDVDTVGIDLLSMSGHKLYGPKGIGALYVRSRRPRVRPTPLLFGGGHERGLRSGTLNVPGIVGLGVACELSLATMPTESIRVRALSRQLFDQITSAIPDVELNGHHEHRLPNCVSLYIPGIEAKTLVLSLPELAFSTGAACSSELVEPSHVIIALGLGEDRAYRSIRLGLGRSTTLEQVEFAATRIVGAIQRLRRIQSG